MNVRFCWLIPETDEEDLPVYELNLGQISRLVDDCPLFEYNLVAHDYSWLIAESDHDVYLVCRDEYRS